MKFNSRQILLLAVVAGIVVSLFVMGYKSPSGKSGSEKKPGASAAAFDAAVYLSEQQRLLSEEQKQTLQALESGNSKESLVKLAGFWDSLNVGYAGAYYTYKVAEADPSEMTWYMAGSKFYNVANFSSDSLMTADAIERARQSFDKVLNINPDNLEAKNALAVCIIQGENDVMKGVGMLKEVVAKDSNNVQAVFTLGMLSMQSAQYDKAVERFEKLTRIQPFNPEYYYYLGEAYAKTGDVKKAIRSYETCKTLVKDKEARKEVENIINKLNQL